jgi:hypothetical protein
MGQSVIFRLISTVLVISLVLPAQLSASIFGEVAVALGGTYPQGSFVRYADPGFLINGRATIHVPHVEMFVGWVNVGYVSFANEDLETQGTVQGPSGTVTFPIIQKYSEDLLSLHLGVQLATTTKRAFLRPRAGIGVGVYGFNTDMTWEAVNADTTIEIAREELDSQTKFGWRGMIGIDIFVKSSFGVTSDFVYDHVFNLERVDGQAVADRSSRFHGFTVGIVYMFSVK